MDSLIGAVIGEAALVMVVSSLMGALARRLGQPRVVGQILGGIMLGPSVLGRLPGDLTHRLFPSAALPFLTVLAQVAIVIFMFAVGYELHPRELRTRRRAALLVAAGALLVPMALGPAAVLLFRPGFAALGQTGISYSFMLFMGVAMSVTALPVLAAIVRERGMAGTAAGVTATAAAGLMDVAAWLALAAALVGATHHSSQPWPVTLLMVSAFSAFMLAGVRPALRRWIRSRRALLSSQLPLALALALGSAWVTSSLGLHPILGGFLAGLTMPSADGAPDPEVLRPMEQIGNLLLPMFFTVTGLSLNIGGLDGAAFALLAVLSVLAAAGKLGPAYLAARVGGLGTRDAAAVAALVNTRGLTELIALNTALSAGVIGLRLYAVLVLMALVTTMVTAPLLKLIRAPASLAPAGDALRQRRPDRPSRRPARWGGDQRAGRRGRV